ncbi:LOW QUALITY PROTEIN: rotatin-like [Haliotis rubra]|uniref:LOW QUALITY PROTEIN: rotatin-like n=1 Tax=Haliotis rubra TaxID=36100 RepID=UPI001EE544A4|nr:LOW QUALITY PROTEIN: rotatin-like [Haliotis rubra]
MATLRQDIDFHGLFRKLGHNLEEIRVRALENILSKLEHKLICDADLVNERHLFIRLLEWFNFSSCPKAADVLGLLSRLSQHSAAAEILQDIGGVDFLTQFRENASPGQRPVLDQILEHTMRLPEVKASAHAPECIYHKPADAGLSQTITTIDESTRTNQMSATPRSFGQVSMTTSLPNAERLGCYGDPTTGYFTSLPEEELDPPLAKYEPGGSAGLRVTVFPWLPLTPTDQHVLQSTNSSLQSKDVSMLMSAYEFLSDVVLQDFPAEIFLQRPQIVKSLWSLLGVKSEDNTALLMRAMRTLTDVSRCLHTRLRYYQDPVLYTPKQDFSSSSSSSFSHVANSSSNQSGNSSDTRPSVIGWTAARHRGDGRDGDSSTSSNRTVSGASSLGLDPDIGQLREETDADDSHILQYHQITLPQFCVISLQRALPVLQTQNEAVVVQGMQLLYAVSDLLQQVVTSHVWSETSQPSREVVEKLTDCLNVIGDLLSFHYLGHHNVQEEGPSDLAQHRLAYISVCNYLVHLLQLLPPGQVSSLLPDSLVSALTTLVFDEGLLLAYPITHSTLLRQVQQLDPSVHQQYRDAVTICKSMGHSCRFITGFKQGVASPEELSIQMEEAFPSLPYHVHLPLVSDFIKFFSNIRYKTATEKSTIARCQRCLLRLLAYPLPLVRQQTYKTVLHTVQTSLNVNQAADPKSRTCLRVKFLLDHDVLYEIICFGLADSDPQVATAAGDLTLTLLQGQLLMTDSLWQEFTTALTKSQSVLQSYADSGTVLGKRLKTMLDPVSTADNLPLIEKFRGTLRHMFSADMKLRAESLRQLAWFLSNETDSSNKIPTFSELDVSNLANVFITETPRSLDPDPGRSIFQVSDLHQVYGIFSSKPVDPGVKKSAVDQLAVMLQDQNLHTTFRQEGGLETVLDLVRTGVVKQPQVDAQNANIPYLSACVTILRHLLHHDYTLRHNLAHDSQIYYCLVRVALMFQKDEKVCYEVSHVLTLLLHDEVAKFDVSTSKGGKLGMAFTLPSIITKRYRLPFRPAVHHEVSPHCVVIPPAEDPLQCGPALEKLCVAWNVAWNGGMEELFSLVKMEKQDGEPKEQFSSKLQLSAAMKRVLEVTDFRWGFQQGVYGISNATSHSAVEAALTRLNSFMINIGSLHSSELLPSKDWFTILGRFVQVMPTSVADESLLLEVLKFASITLKMCNQASPDMLPWLADKLYDATGPLIGLLNRSGGTDMGDDHADSNVTRKRSLDRQLLHFIATFNSQLPYQLCKSLKMYQMRGDLAKKLLLRLNVTDAPHFYNLASLEGTLQCLMHLTARPGWSHECTDVDSSSLCSQVLACLLEVVSAFHIGRGSTSMSYMGKGVTKSATMCLRHLAHEMAIVTDDQDWPRSWIYSRRTTDGAGEPGLNWMLTLWAYRDPEVRAAGLGIAVALTSTEMGRIIITENCKHIPGGIWGAAFSILLDQSECSMVRQQATPTQSRSGSAPEQLSFALADSLNPAGSADPGFALVSLVGLTALLALLHLIQFYQMMMVLCCISGVSGRSDSAVGIAAPHPVLPDDDGSVSLVGLTALLALLHHSQFYQMMMMVLCCISGVSGRSDSAVGVAAPQPVLPDDDDGSVLYFRCLLSVSLVGLTALLALLHHSQFYQMMMVSLVGLTALLALLHHSQFYQMMMVLCCISGVSGRSDSAVGVAAPHPVLPDDDGSVSLVGLTALLALLHHSQFYQEMMMLLASLYSNPTVQPVSVTMETQLLSTGNTDSTLSTFVGARHLSMSRDGTNPGQRAVFQRRSVQTPPTSGSSGTPRSGYDGVGDMTSSTTTDTSDTLEYHSVVTPCLVSAVCRLIKNLVLLAPQDTFLALKKDGYISILTSMVSSGQIQECCKEMSSGSNPAQAELAFRDLLQLYDSIIMLLRACVLYDSPSRVEILDNSSALDSIVSLLLIECDAGGDLAADCRGLWMSVFNLLSSLVQLQSSTALDVITHALSKAWTHLTDMFRRLLDMLSEETQAVSLSCMVFLSGICCEEGKITARHPDRGNRSHTLSELLDMQIGRPSDDPSQGPRTSGSSLCKALISTYDLITLKHADRPHSADRIAVINTLKSLLVISQSAKQTALDMGLAESLLQHGKQLHAKLSLEALQLSKSGGRRKEEPLLQELLLLFSLLRNFTASCNKVKLACHHSGLSGLIHRLWAWAQVDNALMTSVLALLLTFTAHCPPATSSLAYTSSSGVPNTTVDGKPCLSSSSLVHCLLKLAGQSTNRDITRLVFSILATLTFSSECRNIMWKSNFFSEFSKLNPHKASKSKWKSPRDVQWMEVLTNLSFSVEGHQIILNISGGVQLLLDYLELGSSRCQESSLLILRNLCCHASNKHKLLANEKLLPALLQCVEEGTEKMQAVAASALWALIFNNQKAKVLMKNANILCQLKDSHQNIVNLATKSDLQTRCADDLKSVISIVAD